MKLKFKAVLAAAITAVSLCALAAGCTAKPEADVPDYGTLSIDDVKVCITQDKSYTFAEIQPVFSKPEKAESLAYTYDTSRIKIEGNTVTPVKRENKEINVRAKSEHFNVVFKVEIEYLKFAEDSSGLYDLSRFDVAQRTELCKEITADTTLFIGDSFMDNYFIGEYMREFAKDRDIVHAGISSTTSYHWEAAYSTVIGSTAPKNIVMHVGTNNFYDVRDLTSDTQDSLTRLFMLIHSKYPSSNIYWFNITQRSDTSYAQNVSETNVYMAEWCEKYDWITCVDTCSKVTTAMLLPDGVHPASQNYKVFTDALVEAGCEITNK